MEEQSGSKLTGIRQIVRLKGLLQKWQSVTFGNSKTNTPKTDKPTRRHKSIGGISPDIQKRLRSGNHCDSDEESSSHGPSDVPKGYLAVYVGPELRRFIIPTRHLSHSLFKVLLEKVEEEFGFDHNGGITIPCEIETFKFLLNCMEHHPIDDHCSHSSGAEAILSH